MQTGFWTTKKEAKKNWEQKLHQHKTQTESCFTGPMLSAHCYSPHQPKRNKTSKTNPLLKKKLSENCPKTFLQLFLCVHRGKLRWSPKSWSFVSDDFFQFSVMFSFKILIFRDGVIMMIWILTNFHHWLLLPLGKIKGSTLNPTRPLLTQGTTIRC